MDHFPYEARKDNHGMMNTQDTMQRLRSGDTDLRTYLNGLCDAIASGDPKILAMVPGTLDRKRILIEAAQLLDRYPNPADRPALFGMPVGIKDIIRASGFPTRCGSKLPPEVFEGPEAECVARIKAAGGIIMGKTVTTEFAYFEPGPTRNPHNPNHTPGGSSSGSAAGVASGFFPLALGSQTGGSVIRPAAYCGVVGFKPSFGRISMDGVMPLSKTLDHLGIFCADPSGIDPFMRVLATDWRSARVQKDPGSPVFGVPDGPYLGLATPHGRKYFERTLERLHAAGLQIKHIPFLQNIEEINDHLLRLMWAEIARSHDAWYRGYGHLYSAKMRDAVEQGRKIGDGEHAALRAETSAFRRQVEEKMHAEGIDAWLCPSTMDSAPEGLDSTGSPIMNFSWTFGGFPALSLPADKDDLGLPHGLQVVGFFMKDEELVAGAQMLHDAISTT